MESNQSKLKQPIKSALKSTSNSKSGASKRATSPPRGPVAGCPNTSNPYHECSVYCKERYGSAAKKSVGFSEGTKDGDDGFPKPEDEVEDKLPLPPYWIKVIDPAR